MNDEKQKQWLFSGLDDSKPVVDWPGPLDPPVIRKTFTSSDFVYCEDCKYALEKSDVSGICINCNSPEFCNKIQLTPMGSGCHDGSKKETDDER